MISIYNSSSEISSTSMSVLVKNYVLFLNHMLKKLEKNIKKLSKKTTEATLDENHFLMIDLTTNTPHIVDEEWFVDVNESSG